MVLFRAKDDSPPMSYVIRHYATEILQNIKAFQEKQGVGRARKLNAHEDNARPQAAKLSLNFLEANRITKALHPPYSPDVVPSDFLLFGDVKRRLSERSLDNAADLLTVICEI
jgi:hypothetical protein